MAKREQLQIEESNPAQQRVPACTQALDAEQGDRCGDIPPADDEAEWRHTIPLLEEELTPIEPAVPAN